MVKHRNSIMVIVLFFITFGIYGLFWLYSTSDELIRLTNKNASALLWLVLALIPILNIITLWNHSQAVAEVSKMEGREGGGINGVLLFICRCADRCTSAGAGEAEGEWEVESVG